MAADKDAAKRRRQARNRQERERRQKRIEAAKRSDQKAKAASSGETGSTKSGGRGPAKAGASSSGGFMSRIFPPRATATAAEGKDGRPSRSQPTRAASGGDDAGSDSDDGVDTPSRTSTGRPARRESAVVEVADVGGLRGFVLRATAQPGGRATLLALLLSIVSAATLLGFPVIPRLVMEGFGQTVVDASGDDAVVKAFDDADPVTDTVRFLDTPNPLIVALFALIPILIAGTAARALSSPSRSRTLLISAIAAAIYTLFTGAIGIYFFLGVACLGWASFQSRKADAMIAAAEG